MSLSNKLIVSCIFFSLTNQPTNQPANLWRWSFLAKGRDKQRGGSVWWLKNTTKTVATIATPLSHCHCRTFYLLTRWSILSKLKLLIVYRWEWRCVEGTPKTMTRIIFILFSCSNQHRLSVTNNFKKIWRTYWPKLNVITWKLPTLFLLLNGKYQFEFK